MKAAPAPTADATSVTTSTSATRGTSVDADTIVDSTPRMPSRTAARAFLNARRSAGAIGFLSAFTSHESQLLLFFRQIEQPLDGRAQRVRETQREHGGRYEDAVLNGVDGLARDADAGSQFRLRQAVAAALFFQAVPQSAGRHALGSIEVAGRRDGDEDADRQRHMCDRGR